MPNHGYAKIAACSPPLRLGDPAANAERIAALWRMADERGALCALFPELCVTGATCGDLFFREDFLHEALDALLFLRERSEAWRCAALVGLPLRALGRVVNAEVLLCRGEVLCIAVKHPGAERARWFAPYDDTLRTMELGGGTVFLGERTANVYGATVGVDTAEGVDIALFPAAERMRAGARVEEALALSSRSALCAAAYANAGPGESSGAGVYAGECFIAEGGEMLARGERFRGAGQIVLADVDLAGLSYARRQGGLTPGPDAPEPEPFDRVLSRHPFFPDDDAFFEDAFSIQAAALERRLRHIGTDRVVLALSGGLDSTAALLAAREALDRLGAPPDHLTAVSMPGLATSARTKGSAGALALLLGCDFREIDIRRMCLDELAAIGHDGRADITFENVQARRRTQIAMDLANHLGALQLATGDMSELALGWCTYGGDQIGMYGVNGGIPKTLLQRVVRWYAHARADEALRAALLGVLDTPISPELRPAAPGEEVQSTEEALGPYELHDFFLYHLLARGAGEEKLRFLALRAFEGIYSPERVERALETFLRRFYAAQFKRATAPEGPAVLEVSLDSPGGLRMPSDMARRK